MFRGLFGHNKTRLLMAIMLSFIVLAAAYPQRALAQTDSFYNKNFQWDYKGQHWSWNISIPKQLYDEYKSVPVSTRTQYGPAGYGFCTTTKDPYIQSLAKELNDTSNQLGYGAFDKVSFTLAFVQSLLYTSDSVTTGHDEYPRFPIETLVDDGGDCEDTSILFATLTLIMGFGTVYINPPNHYAVGVLGNNLRGTYWTYPEGSNQTYYYCETTGDGFMIGQMPEQFIGQSANIYTIDESKQYIPQVEAPSVIFPNASNTIVLTTSTPKPAVHISNDTSPMISQPTSETLLPPLTLDIIYDNPLLYVLALFSLVITIGFAVGVVKKHKSTKQ